MIFLNSDYPSQNYMGSSMHTWQSQEAKAHFLELVKLSESEGPQHITLHGRSAAVHGLSLVTRNTKDFEYLDLEVINPWNED